MKIKTYSAIKQVFIMLFGAVLLLSCNNDDDNKDTEGPAAQTKTVVYASGYGWSGDQLVGARYWKDGELVALTDNANDVRVNGIFVSGEDVYVVGEERSPDTYVAKYWENGISVEVTDGSETAFGRAIAIDKGDVYVAGNQFEPVLSTRVSRAKYWKNGVEYPLSEKKAHHTASANAMVIDGNDVYVAGYEKNGNFDVAKYWKNGESVELTAGLSSNAHATGIAIVNGNVHVSGHEFIDGIVVPTYWLNGVPTRLSNPGVGYWTVGMAISDGDVYILVRENGASVQNPDKIGYWKVGHSIIKLTNGENFGSVYGIAADGKDIYVVGDYRIAGGSIQACIWKNTEMTILPGGGSERYEANGIFLAKEPI